MQLISAFSDGYYLLCLLAGLAYAWLLYHKTATNLSLPWLIWPLSAFRALAVAGVVLLLLNPYLKSEEKVIEKPLVVLAIDNSRSMLHQADSSALAKELQQLTLRAQETLSGDYDLRQLRFGADVYDSLSFDFSEPATDLSRLFNRLQSRFSGRQLAAVVLVSDGIYNRGFDPLPLAEQLGVPVYSLPLGDTSIRRDLVIQSLRANEVVFINSDFTILADIEVNQLAGKTAQLRLEAYQEGGFKTIAREVLPVTRDRFFSTIQFIASAEKAGINRYRVVAEIEGEDGNTEANNQRDIFVEVVDSRTRVLLVAHGAHPDIASIRQALESNAQYDFGVRFAWEPFSLNEKPDLVILHQLPSSATHSGAWLNGLQKMGVPLWYIVGSQTQLLPFNQQQQLLAISTRSGGINKVQATLNPNFRLFGVEPDLQEGLQMLPPLDAPFGDYRMSPLATPLMLQRIGSVATDMPLWLLSDKTEQRMAILAGEGLWRWQLAEAELKSRKQLTAEYIRKTVQFLAVRDEKRPFIVRTNRKRFEEQEDILFEAELYNKSYEPVNEPDVRLLVQNEEGQQYNFSMGRTRQHYFLNAGALPPGNYTFEADVKLAGDVYNSRGSFAISAMELEKINTVANHALLASISALSDGKTFPLGDHEALFTAIKQHELARPVSYTQSRLSELISMQALMYLLLLLLSIEWLTRRYAGAY
ncbi:MAG: hypothetical protein ACK417_12425 [Bacteroidia bacterium]